MPEIDILYSHYYTPDGSCINIGGIQTYITQLCDLINEMGYRVNIYQYAVSNFKKVLKDDKVILYGIKTNGNLEEKNEAVMRAVKNNNNLLIYATDSMIPMKNYKKGIVIQHGISWDIPRTDKAPFLRAYVGKALSAYKTILRVQKAGTVVCVDYNFLNWYRALVGAPSADIHVIPNFSKIPNHTQIKENGRIIKVIFARRFYEYRGTKLFAKVVLKLLQTYENLDVTFAGEGPDGEWLKNTFNKYNNVHFISYKSTESLQIHSNKDIAVVPTIGSEGTSLSLIEAMASQCAVVCTNVGGMTNIIIDHYNGIMINPDFQSLYNALVEVIENADLRKRLSLRAFETVKEGFSFDLWKKRWIKVIYEELQE